MEKNTQQQASWEYFDGTWHVGVDGERENYEMFGYPTRDLHTAPPVPRDVLMAALNEANSKTLEICGACFSDEYIAAIADRYASQVQPEPVNQQMLAAMMLALPFVEDHEDSEIYKAGAVKKARNTISAAIAAAEAAQPGHIVDADKMVQAVPVAIDRATIRQIFMAHGFTIKDGQTDLKPYVYEAAEELLRAQHPASAQPVALLDGYVLVTVSKLKALKASINGEYYMGAVWEAETINDMLSAAQKQEGV